MGPVNHLRNYFLHFERWQSDAPLVAKEDAQFGTDAAWMQWWYFDVFTEDGGTLVWAFIPRDWWSDRARSRNSDARMIGAWRDREGKVLRFSENFSANRVRSTPDSIEVPNHFRIARQPGARDRRYVLEFSHPAFDARLEIKPTAPRFSAFPRGRLPGVARSIAVGAPWGARALDYVSQVPRGEAVGTLSVGDLAIPIRGIAYHEQGRMDDAPATLGKGWTWFHFIGGEWTIFGNPGVYLYLRRGDTVLRSGLSLLAKTDYVFRNRKRTSADHPRIWTGGEITFSHDGLTFSLRMDPDRHEPLITAPSGSSEQVWATVSGSVSLRIRESESSPESEVPGRMILETCSTEEGPGESRA